MLRRHDDEPTVNRQSVHFPFDGPHANQFVLEMDRGDENVPPGLTVETYFGLMEVLTQVATGDTC